MHVPEEALLEFLRTSGLAGKRDLENLAEDLKRDLPLERAVIRRGLLSERDLNRAIAHILGLPFVDLTEAKLDLAVLSHIPEPLSRLHNAVAFKKEGNELGVALLDLSSLPEVKFVEALYGVSLAPHLTDVESLRRALRVYQDALRAEYGETIEREARSIREPKGGARTATELEALAGDARIGKIVDSLISHALLSKATNVHIVPTQEDVRVRYRVGGKLHDAAILPKHVGEHVALRTKKLSGLALNDSLPQDGRFGVRTAGGEASIRVSLAPTAHGEKVMLRVLSKGAHGFTLESLGLAGETLERVEEALHAKEGLILVSGPKGAGKSTFLYTALDVVDSVHLAVQTVEDPIEFPLARAEQTQVDRGAGLTFARALRGGARADTDVLMASKVPDAESANILSAAALSGELVLASVEAGSAPGGVLELIRLGADKNLLSSALLLVVGVRLVPRLGRDREKYFLNREEIRSLGTLIDLDRMLSVLKREGAVAEEAEWKDIPFWRPRRGAGYEGLIGLYECLNATPRVRELVTKGASLSSLTNEQTHVSLSLLEDGLVKAVQGLTTLEEVLKNAALA